MINDKNHIISFIMERIDCKQLLGANAYFTNFDQRIVASSSNHEQLKKNAERVLKVLLLTKNNVVCAASHLFNDVAFDIIQKNPVLLDEKMLIPAYRDDHSDLEELIDNKTIDKSKKDTMLKFYKDHLSKTVNWNLFENSNWFQTTFIKGLTTEHSVVRSNLSSLTASEIELLIEKVTKEKVLSREVIENISKNYSKENQLIIRNYRELVYHMSGARVVNCESTLPQENYIDYSLTDIKNRKTILSEYHIFSKLFIELLFESLGKQKIQIELLDCLSFDDISKIRIPILESSFIEGYNKLFYESVESSVSKEKEDNQLYDLNEISKIRVSLENSFKTVFDEELKTFAKNKKIGVCKSIIKDSVEFGIGFIPFIGNIIDTASYIKHLYFNLINLLNSNRDVKDYYTSNEQKCMLLKDSIEKQEIISDKHQFIDFYELLSSTIKSHF